MKRLQELEFECRSENVATIMKRLEKKNKNFYDIWGEMIENLIKQDGDYNTIDERDNGFFIGVEKQENSTYIWYIATTENQIVEEV